MMALRCVRWVLRPVAGDAPQEAAINGRLRKKNAGA
jgi:hypothetical protein